jgi:hypothetical protein
MTRDMRKFYRTRLAWNYIDHSSRLLVQVLAGNHMHIENSGGPHQMVDFR